MNELQTVARELAEAAKQVPVVARSDKRPFSTCLGCGATDDEQCKPACWAMALENAADAVDEALADRARGVG